MSCHRTLLLENDENQCFDDQVQLSLVEGHPRGEDQTDAVLWRGVDDEVHKIKDDTLENHQETGRRQITKIIRLLFGCGITGTSDHYDILNLGCNIFSIGVYFSDVVTDLVNGLRYYDCREENSEYMSYFIYTISIVVLSSIVIQIYSYVFERADINQQNNREFTRRKCCSWTQSFMVLLHLFQLASVLRLFRIVRLGIKSLQMKIKCVESSNQDTTTVNYEYYDKKWRRALSDMNHIKIVESFLESAPQLVLQLYIMIDSRQTPVVTVFSCVFSLLGFALGYVGYQRSIRSSQYSMDYQVSIIGSLLIAVYQALTVLARVLALALLLDCNAVVFMGFFGGRLLISWIAVYNLNVDYCEGTIKKTLDALVIGLGYHFTYVNVKDDGKNKCRIPLYYAETFVENISFAVLWYFQREQGVGFKEMVIGHAAYTAELQYVPKLEDSTAFYIVSFIPAVNMLGIIVMLVYYMCAHPHLGCCSCCKKPTPTEDIEMPPIASVAGEDVSSPSLTNGDDIDQTPVQESTLIPAGEALFT